MTSDGAFVLLRTTLDLRAHALAILVPGTTLDVSAGDVLRTSVSLLFLAFLSWPILITAVAGAWLVFVKAGRPGWACLVPGYNLAQFLRLAKLPRRSWMLLLVPGVNVVLFAVACTRLARAFRKGPSFAVGLVLFPPVYMTILGMSRARYRPFEILSGAKRRDVDTEPLRLVGSRPAPAPTLTSVSPSCRTGFRGGEGEAQRARKSLGLASTAAGEPAEERAASPGLIQFPGMKGVASGHGRCRTPAGAIEELRALDTRAPRSRASRPLHLV